MYTALQKLNDSEFQTVYCTKLVVLPVTTNLKWSNTRKHSRVQIQGAADVAKVSQKGSIYGVLGDNPFIVGVDVIKWVYNVLMPSIMFVGIAKANQILTSANAVASVKINAADGDNVRFSLTTQSLIITHETGVGDYISSSTYNLSSLAGQTIYAWACTDYDNLLSIKILKDINVIVTADAITGADIKGPPGPEGPVGPVGPAGSSSVLENKNTDSKVEINDNGAISIFGGINLKYENITTNITNYTLQNNQFAIAISNVNIRNVILPSIINSNQCQVYFIVRNYPEQKAENKANPYFTVIPSGGATIEGDLFIWIPGYANIKLISNNISNTWVII
jgi:hypothetical protein